MVTFAALTFGSGEVGVMVCKPEPIENVIVQAAGHAPLFACAIASRSEPVPLSFVFVTTMPALTVKLVELLVVPMAFVTETGPAVAPLGTVVVMEIGRASC